MIANKLAVFSKDRMVFESYEQFANHGTKGFEGQTLAFVNVEYRKHGTKIHQICGIVVTTLTIPEDGSIAIHNLVLGSSSSEILLPEQKPLVHKWILSWIPQEAWTLTNRHIKRTIS
ncbi:hypothetical protein D3C78_18660 [compost metagenome]